MSDTTSYAAADAPQAGKSSWLASHSDQDARPLSPTDHSQASDKELAALAARGRESAFRELLLRYERPVFSLIFRMVRDRTLA
jgi:hypothetical protein